MDYQTTGAPSRLHPLTMIAAVSVTLVSLVGLAAITGILPNSHGQMTSPPSTGAESILPLATLQATTITKNSGTPTRYLTPDGQLLEVVPNTQLLTPVQQASPVRYQPVRYEPAPVVQRKVVQQKVVHHYVQNNYQEPVRTSYPNNVQPNYTSQRAHPIANYVSDMHPVGTGVGAVVGGVIGNQIGGGNGKKLATVAGVLLGGYAGNEVAHDRNPLAW